MFLWILLGYTVEGRERLIDRCSKIPNRRWRHELTVSRVPKVNVEVRQLLSWRSWSVSLQSTRFHQSEEGVIYLQRSGVQFHQWFPTFPALPQTMHSCSQRQPNTSIYNQCPPPFIFKTSPVSCLVYYFESASGELNVDPNLNLTTFKLDLNLTRFKVSVDPKVAIFGFCVDLDLSWTCFSWFPVL